MEENKDHTLEELGRVIAHGRGGAASKRAAGVTDRKLTIMSKILDETQAALSTDPSVTLVPADSEEHLVAPDEWDTLLKTAEAESSTHIASRNGVSAAELSTEDIWKRLSSTRWLKEPSSDSRRSSTIAHSD